MTDATTDAAPRPEQESGSAPAAGHPAVGHSAPGHPATDHQAVGRPAAGHAIATPLACFLDGGRRVARAPAVLAGVWLLTLLLGIPYALALHEAIASHFGDSLAANEAARGFSLDWWDEYAAKATGLEATFRPSVIGFAATLRNLSDLADGGRPTALLAGLVALWLLAWAFLWGGILDRFARGGATRATTSGGPSLERASERPSERATGRAFGRTAGFFASCGAHAGRMLRLAVMSGVAYAALMGLVQPLLFEWLYPALTRELAVERTAFFIRLALYALFGAAFFAIHLLTDLARVRAVVEDRRSMLGAYVAGWRLLKARPSAVLGVYALAGVAFLVLLALYALLAPGARVAGFWIWVAFIGSQLYLLARLWLKLQVPAALTGLCQSGANAAAPIVDRSSALVWPESPAVREE